MWICVSRAAQPTRINPASVARQSCRIDLFISPESPLDRDWAAPPATFWQLDGPGLLWRVIVFEQRDLVVWGVSALLAFGIGWSRFAKNRARNDLVRQLAAMEPEQRKKMLSHYSPKVALELRQELLEKFRIMC